MGEARIQLSTAPTPNGWKVSVTLEELGLPYGARLVNLLANEQKQPEFLRINPNGRIPVIVDPCGPNGELVLFESGAILMYRSEEHTSELQSSMRTSYAVF